MTLILGLGNKCLDVKGGIDTSETPIILFDAHGGANQQWIYTTDGAIVSALNQNKCLDIQGGVAASETPIILFDRHGGANQRWSLTPDGLIVSALDPNKCLDVKGGTDANETPIILFDRHGGINQKWRLSDTLPPPPRAVDRIISKLNGLSNSGKEGNLNNWGGGIRKSWSVRLENLSANTLAATQIEGHQIEKFVVNGKWTSHVRKDEYAANSLIDKKWGDNKKPYGDFSITADSLNGKITTKTAVTVDNYSDEANIYAREKAEALINSTIAGIIHNVSSG